MAYFTRKPTKWLPLSTPTCCLSLLLRGRFKIRSMAMIFFLNNKWYAHLSCRDLKRSNLCSFWELLGFYSPFSTSLKRAMEGGESKSHCSLTQWVGMNSQVRRSPGILDLTLSQTPERTWTEPRDGLLPFDPWCELFLLVPCTPPPPRGSSVQQQGLGSLCLSVQG